MFFLWNGACYVHGYTVFVMKAIHGSCIRNLKIFVLCYRYMRPAKKGDTISIVAECLKVGKTMAFVNVDIFNKSNENKLIAQGRHTKFL